MTDFSKATPRPWRVEVRHSMDAADEYIIKSKGLGVAYHAKEPDATLIVEAVNSYDANKALIAELVEALECYAEQTAESETFWICDKNNERIAPFNSFGGRARAVLAKARR
jgi:hypothetical protein